MRLRIMSALSSGITKTLISEKDVGPYVVRKEMWYHSSNEDGTEMTSAYTHDGAYIGNEKDAKHLYTKYGIIPQLSEQTHSVCSIGKSEKDGKWYGWSHRAIHGFKIGDRIKEGDCGYDPERGAYRIATEDQAKQAAIDFASSVSSSSTLLLSVSALSDIRKFESDSKKPHKIKNPILLKIRMLEKQIDKLREQHKKQVKAKLQKKLQKMA